MLTGQNIPGSPRKPRPLPITDPQNSASHVASAIRELMGSATESTLQSRQPVNRRRSERLLSAIKPTDRRRYENVYVSHSVYIPNSDVSAGLAWTDGEPLARNVVLSEQAWSFGKNSSNPDKLEFSPLSSEQLDVELKKLNITGQNELANTFISTHKKTRSPLTREKLRPCSTSRR